VARPGGEEGGGEREDLLDGVGLAGAGLAVSQQSRLPAAQRVLDERVRRQPVDLFAC